MKLSKKYGMMHTCCCKDSLWYGVTIDGNVRMMRSRVEFISEDELVSVATDCQGERLWVNSQIGGCNNFVSEFVSNPDVDQNVNSLCYFCKYAKFGIELLHARHLC